MPSTNYYMTHELVFFFFGRYRSYRQRFQIHARNLLWIHWYILMASVHRNREMAWDEAFWF